MHSIRISRFDPQEIVGRINALSASNRVRKRQLALAVKDVKRAQRRPVEFSDEQAEQIVADMKKSFHVLSAQNSGMEDEKLANLCTLASLLCGCFSSRMAQVSASIDGRSRMHNDTLKIPFKKKERIMNSYKRRIDALNDDSKKVIRDLDSWFQLLLGKMDFSVREKQIARKHYYAPTVRNRKGIECFSSDDVFSAKEARRRFGGIAIKQWDCGRHTHFFTAKKVDMPTRACYEL
ncbi:hypothetical protein [Xanthomonas theicola]|uniref:Uncharacterized protein n=1 Tax=Xanthomonas theicola TaxID=56464 RepID=A0A2S6Z2C0_9XANT|nr:hypothetical protein [Xanthomonas theicola]PPT74947.1 hypothetical protein XthCFBP4691_19860 [Xanthomonas theicola]QNH25226.1 hypothetical protein G4Q83_11425 [Xanthomonas theicola]